MDEFGLIETYFSKKTPSRPDVILGIGDDAALLRVPSEKLLVAAIDTLVAGVHFPIHTHPFDIGYKALAVNLSDLAAMGAEPAWMTLALTLPYADTEWLEGFSDGLLQLAHQFNLQLVGGDTTRGSLTITVQVNGFVPSNQALCRHGAKIGDKIYVSGTVGDAGLGLQVALEKRELPDAAKQFVLQRLNRPTPRIELGLLLRDLASSAIDISDGLLADLGHIINRSGVGAHIIADQLPMSSTLRECVSIEEAQTLALTAGDDYELCFTVSPQNEMALIEKLNTHDMDCCCIGEIEATHSVRVSGFSGNINQTGFRHFAKRHNLERERLNILAKLMDQSERLWPISRALNEKIVLL